MFRSDYAGFPGSPAHESIEPVPELPARCSPPETDQTQHDGQYAKAH
jgi:hypothetical protein